jgi:hypothetical protein
MKYKPEGPFRFIVRALEICCPYEYLRQTRREASQDLADYLGFDVRTIRYWRLRYRNGIVACERCSDCVKRPDAVPIILPRQRKPKRLPPSS